MREIGQLKSTNRTDKVMLHIKDYPKCTGSSRDSFYSLQRAHWAPRHGDEKRNFFGKNRLHFTFFFIRGFQPLSFHSPLSQCTALILVLKLFSLFRHFVRKSSQLTSKVYFRREKRRYGDAHPSCIPSSMHERGYCRKSPVRPRYSQR